MARYAAPQVLRGGTWCALFTARSWGVTLSLRGVCILLLMVVRTSMVGMQVTTRKAFRPHPLAGRMLESLLLCLPSHCQWRSDVENPMHGRVHTAICSSSLLCASQVDFAAPGAFSVAAKERWM